ncbi:helix-turn-helix transcriptional regulator [Imperialibacter roseus]|uniref:Helix-turn-helix transcriptional regulator n=1 Tax=Imperialibacter roseus TaxID=1324217 RepID=A0ABZ0IUT3_9BACT|nr:helix-turn-helix transcriptional regulator [Imperialibacter roseus]WOK08805.1 helix-turn-helix transcriptional regulator [Imperialibacter roseus]
MKGTNLGELEEMILLVVASLFDNAYGVVIKEEVENKCQRSITISTVHNVLQRLAEKDYLESRYSDPTPERGGKRKLLFRVTKSGQEALENAKSIREQIWQSIPKVAFDRS